jgi:hypothetical protein
MCYHKWSDIRKCIKNKNLFVWWLQMYLVKLEQYFLFNTVRICEFSPMWTDFDKCHHLSKRNVKQILKILSDLEPLKTKRTKNIVFNSFVSFFGTRGPLKCSFHSGFKLAHSCQKNPIYTRTRQINYYSITWLSDFWLHKLMQPRIYYW